MKYNNREVKIPDWISCHTYLFGQDKSRSYISNERRHNYILLEGLASDMWKLLYDNTDESDFICWANQNSVVGQIDCFLNELTEQGTIILENEEEQGVAIGYEQIDVEASGEEESKFVEEMQNWLYENHFIFSLFFELTYRCNLKCVHCYNPKDISDVELDFNQCKKAIDDAYETGCFRVTFSGGEATLHTRFLEIVQYARSKHISVEIFTNGQTLAKNNNLYREILKVYPFRIGISLYSTEKEEHEKVTDVTGSFESTYALIQKLRKDNVNVQIKNFLLNFNCFDCIKVKEFAKEIGATSIADTSLIPTIKGNKKTLKYTLSEEQLITLYCDDKSPLYIGGYKERNYNKIKDSSPCLGGISELCINPNGEVMICVSLPYSVGNLYNVSIKEIWMSAINKDIDSKLYKWQQVTISDFQECNKENYCKFCDFCPGMAYLENGYLKKSDVLCAQAKAKQKAYKQLLDK